MGYISEIQKILATHFKSIEIVTLSVKHKRLSIKKRLIFTHCLQDVDTGYLSRTGLEDNVSCIRDEFNFLKALYDAVNNHSLKIFSKFQLFKENI